MNDGSAEHPRSRRSAWIVALAATFLALALALPRWWQRESRSPGRPAERPRAAPAMDAGDTNRVDATAPNVVPAPDAPDAPDASGPPARARHPAHRGDGGARDAPAATPTPTIDAAPEPGPAEVSVRSSVFGYIRVDSGPEFPSPTPPLRLAPGAHRARVRYPGMGGAEAEFTFRVSAGERRVIVVSPTGE